MGMPLGEAAKDSHGFWFATLDITVRGISQDLWGEGTAFYVLELCNQTLAVRHQHLS